jgi:transposase-like protein
LSGKPYDDKFKIKIALRAILEEDLIPELANQHSVSQKTIKKWMKQFLKDLSSGTFSKQVDPRIAECERVKELLYEKIEQIGPQETEIKFFKKFKINHAKSEFIVAIATGFMVIATAVMAYFTAQMACATKEYVEFYEKRTPKLNIGLLIESKFDLLKKNKIIFKAGDYLDNKKVARFHLNVKSEWHKNIEDNLEMQFIAAVFYENEEPYEDKGYLYKTKETINLIPQKIKKIEVSDEIQKELLWKFNWEKIDRDYIIKIEIDENSVNLPNNPPPVCGITYGKYKNRKDKYP